ncbi:MAG: hypothetical protein Q9178_002798 [Gyalolechia marmorata]
MVFSNMLRITSVFTLLLTLSAAIPHPASNTLHQLSPREPTACGTQAASDCQGIYSDESCVGFGRTETTPQDAVTEVGYLAHAALRALHTVPGMPSAQGNLTDPIHPADHFFYLFENDLNVAKFVENVFTNIANCADRHDCPYSLISCEDTRSSANGCLAPPRYGYVEDGYNTTINPPKVTMCTTGFAAFWPIPLPCTTPGGEDRLGSGLLAQMVQVYAMTRPNVTFLQEQTGSPNITILSGITDPKYKWAQGMDLAELGYGITNGDGLRARGLANAQNYVEFAKWSWDLNFGDAPQLVNNTKCLDHFTQYAAEHGAKPISTRGRNMLETVDPANTTLSDAIFESPV